MGLVRRRIKNMEELYKIFIYPKNKIVSNVATLDNIDEYYCTDKMFYAHENLSDVTHYYSLDLIEEIMARPMNVKKEEV